MKKSKKELAEHLSKIPFNEIVDYVWNVYEEAYGEAQHEISIDHENELRDARKDSSEAGYEQGLKDGISEAEQILFAIDVLMEVKTKTGIDDKIKELEIERCRHL